MADGDDRDALPVVRDEGRQLTSPLTVSDDSITHLTFRFPAWVPLSVDGRQCEYANPCQKAAFQ
jgi:hypothetical protein